MQCGECGVRYCCDFESFGNSATPKNESYFAPPSVDGAPTVASQSDIKIQKKKLKKLEEEITGLEKEKLKLSRKQAKNPTKFLSEDYVRLGEIIKNLESKEEEWLKLSAI